MTVFEVIKSMSVDELAEWLDKHGMFDGSPWMNWFDKNYCLKCESEFAYVPNLYGDRKAEFGYCELHGCCRYFKDEKEVPDNKRIIRMWLETEVDG